MYIRKAFNVIIFAIDINTMITHGYGCSKDVNWFPSGIMGKYIYDFLIIVYYLLCYH